MPRWLGKQFCRENREVSDMSLDSFNLVSSLPRVTLPWETSWPRVTSSSYVSHPPTRCTTMAELTFVKLTARGGGRGTGGWKGDSMRFYCFNTWVIDFNDCWTNRTPLINTDTSVYSALTCVDPPELFFNRKDQLLVQLCLQYWSKSVVIVSPEFC